MLSSPRKVMLVEKSISHLHLLHEIVAQDGHAVTIARSGQEALNLLGSGNYMPDVIFLGLELEDMPGLDALQVYRMGITTPAPVFFIVDDASSEALDLLRDYGAHGILRSPLQSHEIREAIKSTCVEVVGAVRHLRAVATGYADTLEAGSLGGNHPTPKLRPIPTLYVDAEVIDSLAEVSTRAEFLPELIEFATTDIALTTGKLSDAIKDERWVDVKKGAHALKGVALQMGATQLGRYADLIEQLAELVPKSDWCKVHDELTRVSAATLGALRKERDDRRIPITRVKPGSL